MRTVLLCQSSFAFVVDLVTCQYGKLSERVQFVSAIGSGVSLLGKIAMCQYLEDMETQFYPLER